MIPKDFSEQFCDENHKHILTYRDCVNAGPGHASWGGMMNGSRSNMAYQHILIICIVASTKKMSLVYFCKIVQILLYCYYWFSTRGKYFNLCKLCSTFYYSKFQFLLTLKQNTSIFMQMDGHVKKRITCLIYVAALTSVSLWYMTGGTKLNSKLEA